MLTDCADVKETFAKNVKTIDNARIRCFACCLTVNYMRVCKYGIHSTMFKCVHYTVKNNIAIQ